VELAPGDAVEVGFLSGACLAIPRLTWDEVGGFPEEFFMYCEDVDMSLRLRLRGCRLAVAPRARVIHDYEFDRGASKWRLLERNRWAMMVRTYPASLLALLTPALIATEVAIWFAAFRGGWLRMKASASLDIVRALPRLLAERAAIQRSRAVTARAFAAGLTPELSSPYLGRLEGQALVALVLRIYWRTTLALLR
jgi:GT2 family glycosyltransferase